MGRVPSDVISQEVFLVIDTGEESFQGWTELRCHIPQGADYVGLHAYGLRVSAVQVDGQAASFTTMPPATQPFPALLSAAQYMSDDKMVDAVAQAAAYQYERILQKERIPELEVALAQQRDGSSPAVVRIDYDVHRPKCGISFFGGYAATDNQVRRASAWLPCVDVPGSVTNFKLHLTVRAGQVAVGPGLLVKQTWADEARHWKTYHYDVPLPCAPHDLGFAVGDFEVVPSSVPAAAQGGSATVFTTFAPASHRGTSAAEQGNLVHTAKFSALPFALYQSAGVLATPFPLPSMQQVFLPPELAQGQARSCVGLQMLGLQHLINARSVEQSQAARCTIAAALGRQWFGQFIRPATADDAWLVEGLAGWLEEQYVAQYLGKTELAYRRWRQREAIAAADQGDAPPLAFRAISHDLSPWGPLHGTERLDPSPLRLMKATAVVGMLERRAGEALFRKHLEALVAAAAKTSADRGEQGPRHLDAVAFVNDLGRAPDFKKDVAAFLERWVYGRGSSHLHAGLAYNRKGSVLAVAIHQAGGEEAKRSADAAELANQQHGGGFGMVKVVVKHGSGGVEEHDVRVGPSAWVKAQCTISAEVKKVPGKRGRKRKEDEEIMAAKAAAAENAQHPVQWVRLDPIGDWLCCIRLQQPERMLLNQLKDSRDVVAQSDAVRELGQLRVSPQRQGPLKVLADTLINTHVHCRVRMDAAMALAALRDEDGKAVGLCKLMSYYTSWYCATDHDGPSRELIIKPVSFADVSEYLVAQAVVTAIATCGPSHDIEVIHFLLAATQQFIDAWEPYDASGLLASLCYGVGELRPSPEIADDVRSASISEFERLLDREFVAPGPGCVVGVACLSAMVSLVSRGHCSLDMVHRVLTIVGRCTVERMGPVEIRKAASQGLVRLLVARYGVGKALEHTLRLHSRDAFSGHAAMLELLELASLPGSGREKLCLALLCEAGALIDEGHDTRLRHSAFMLLRCLQREPPNLYALPVYEREQSQALRVLHYGPATSANAPPHYDVVAPVKVKLALGSMRVARSSSGATLSDVMGAGATLRSDVAERGAALEGEVDQRLSGVEYSPNRRVDADVDVPADAPQPTTAVEEGTTLSSPVATSSAPALGPEAKAPKIKLILKPKSRLS